MARRVDNLFAHIASFHALRAAARKAVRGKRRKPGASSFMAGLESELIRLEDELLRGLYRPGKYVEILVHDPKERLVSAAPFRDRVVHHALCAVVCPIFEAGFIANSYREPNRQRHTQRQSSAFTRHTGIAHTHVLRADIFRYFPAIDHAILKDEFRRRISCERTIALMDVIVDASNPQELVELHYPGR